MHSLGQHGLQPVQWGIKQFEGVLYLRSYEVQGIVISFNRSSGKLEAFKFPQIEEAVLYEAGPVDFLGSVIWNADENGRPTRANLIYSDFVRCQYDMRKAIKRIEKDYITSP